MDIRLCSECMKPKALLTCGICDSALCKKCAQFIDEEHFSFMVPIPHDLSRGTYCNPCMTNTITPAMEEYDQQMARAKSLNTYDVDQTKETRWMDKSEPALLVENVLDREESLLRLAFMAVNANYNVLVDVDLTYTKVNAGRYQHFIWKATGIPVMLDDGQLAKLK